MLDSLPIILIIGTVLGFLTGLGVGGGSLLILWLTFAIRLEQTAARGINLLFFLPSAIIACLLRSRQKELEWREFLPAICSGCAAAILCSFLAPKLDSKLLGKGFGILLLIVGFRELFYRERNAR